MTWRWQCQYHSSKGVRCPERAVLRLQFSLSHPFDHMDVCHEHLKEYANVAWSHELSEDWNADIRKSNKNHVNTASLFSSTNQTETSSKDSGERQSVSGEAKEEKLLPSISDGVSTPVKA